MAGGEGVAPETTTTNLISCIYICPTTNKNVSRVYVRQYQCFKAMYRFSSLRSYLYFFEGAMKSFAIFKNTKNNQG